MIVTVTLNPALDKAIVVDKLVLGESNPIKSFRTDPGGKGINVSRMVAEIGRKTLALGFCGGETGAYISQCLKSRGVNHDFVEIEGNTRTNLTLVITDTPPATEFNSPGPEIKPAKLLELEKKILTYLPDASLFVFAGSLPKGLPTDTYARLIHLVEVRGARAVLDTHGDPLTEALKETPYMIKPNRYEAEKLLGRELKTLDEIVEGACELKGMGIKVVSISLGSEGAILCTDDGVYRGYSPKVEAQSGVGAGDSLVAGLCVGIIDGMPWDEAFRLGLVAGAATAVHPGTQLGTREDIERLMPEARVESLERHSVKS